MTTDYENTPNETEVTAELAKPEDVTAYVEERTEQEAEDAPPSDEVDALAKQVRDTNPEFKEAKKASRYERLKRARDQYKAENEELRSRLGQSAEADTPAPESSWKETAQSVDTVKLESSLEAAQHLHGDGFQKAYQAFVDHVARTGDQAAYQRVMTSTDQGAELVQWWNEQGSPEASPEAVEAAMQQGRQDQEFQQQLAERDAEIRVQEAARLRSEAFAAQCPDFYETVASVEGVDELPPLMLDLIRRSSVGPEMAYALAKDFWDVNSNGWLDHAQTLTHDPIAQARMVGAMEQAILTSRSRGNSIPGTAQGRATKAPPPLSPVRGGASAPKDLHSLAKSDSADDYIRARRSAP